MRDEGYTSFGVQEGVALFGLLGVLVLVTLLGGGEGVAQGFWPMLLIGISVLAWLLGMFKRGRFAYRRTSFDLPLILFFVLFLSSTFLSPYRYNSMLGLHRFLSYVGIFLLAVNLLHKPKSIRVVGFAILVLALGEAAFALYQRHFLGLGRVTGTLNYSTYLMDYLALGLSLALGVLLFDSMQSWVRSILLTGSVLLLYSIFLTRTRAGLFSLLAVFLTLGWLRGKRTLLVFLLLLLLVVVIPNPITERLFGGRKLDIYALERINIWRQALKVGFLRPFCGVGFGNFEFFSRRFNFPVAEAVGRYGRVAKIAHNQFLQLFADAGVFGLLILLYSLFLFFRSLPRLLPSMSGMEKGFIAGIVAFLLHSLFDNPLYLPANSMLLCLSFGFVIGRVPLRDIRKEFRPRRAHLILISVLGLAGIHCAARPAAAQLVYQKAKYHAEKAEYGRAIRLCERASFLAPDCAVYYDALGKLYSARFGKSEALSDLWLAYRRFQESVAANPVDARLYRNFAEFLISHSKNIDIGEGKRDEHVVELLEKAIELNPYNPFFRGRLASVYQDLGRLQEARNEFEMVIELEPNYIQAYYFLGVVHEKMGELEKARELYGEALSFRERDLRPRAQSEYEQRLLEFDWSLLER